MDGHCLPTVMVSEKNHSLIFMCARISKQSPYFSIFTLSNQHFSVGIMNVVLVDITTRNSIP